MRERLGDTPLMAQSMGHKVRKRKTRAAILAAGPGSGAGGGGGSGLPDSDRASLVSAAYTYRTASTYKTKASQPDFLRIPGEYEKVGRDGRDAACGDNGPVLLLVSPVPLCQTSLVARPAPFSPTPLSMLVRTLQTIMPTPCFQT